MFEKVNPSHPDKIADRIAGALVDLAYKKDSNPKIAVEVLIGHGDCHIIAETSVHLNILDVEAAVSRIAGAVKVDYVEVPQDPILAKNQSGAIRCGDNGIFKGTPLTAEQNKLAWIARKLYEKYPSDGKFILDDIFLTVCQSNANTEELKELFIGADVNPLGDWTGGITVDTGATNRKLGSDMGDSVTGGGLHGKDLSKADVSANIYAWIEAQDCGCPIQMWCAIGDEDVECYRPDGTMDYVPYSRIVEVARNYIKMVGGFEKFAEWGLI